MGRQRPDQSFLEELEKLSQHLSDDHFQALAPGIGFGRPIPGTSVGQKKSTSVKMRPPAPRPDHLPERLPPPPGKKSPQTHVVPPPPPVAAGKKDAGKKNAARAAVGWQDLASLRADPAKMVAPTTSPQRQDLWTRLVKPHLIDMAVIVGSILVCFSMVGFGFHILETRNLKMALVNLLLPFKIMKILGPVRTLLVVYAVFLCYWAFFRVLSGRTYGQTLLARRRNHGVNHGFYQNHPNSPHGGTGV